jgi:hypothetical protein
MVVLACNPSTLEAEAGGSGVQGQPRLHRTKSSKNEKKKKKRPGIVAHTYNTSYSGDRAQKDYGLTSA